MRRGIRTLLMTLVSAAPLAVSPLQAEASPSPTVESARDTATALLAGVSHAYLRTSSGDAARKWRLDVMRHTGQVRDTSTQNLAEGVTRVLAASGSPSPVTPPAAIEVNLAMLEGYQRSVNKGNGRSAFRGLELLTHKLESGYAIADSREAAGLTYWLLARACLDSKDCVPMTAIGLMLKANALGYFAYDQRASAAAHEAIAVAQHNLPPGRIAEMSTAARLGLMHGSLAGFVTKKVRPPASETSAGSETLTPGVSTAEEAAAPPMLDPVKRVEMFLGKDAAEQKAHAEALLLGAVLGLVLLLVCRALSRAYRECLGQFPTVDMTRGRTGANSVNTRARFEKC